MSLVVRLLGQFRSLSRFPVPVAIALLLAIVVNLEIVLLSQLLPLEAEAIFALAGAFLAAVIVELVAEGRELNKMVKLTCVIGVGAAIAALQVFHGRLYDQSAVVIGALGLGLMTAAHLRTNAGNESLWNFDLRLGIAVATGILAFLFACGGLSLLLVSIHYLFEINLPDRLYAHIWATGAALIAPLFALAMIPAELDQPFVPSADPDLLERAVAAVLKFVLAPLVLAYALMLHVYAAMIAITWTMPKGEIGSLVLAFGGVGTAVFMIAYPWRERGLGAVRWLIAGWFWLMIIPALLLVAAVWKRIDQYGFTPERYCLCLFALWLVSMAAYLGVMRNRIDLRAIPASLAIGLLLSSFGPWGAVAVSMRSQLRQLYANLQDHHLVTDDQLKLAPPNLATFNRVTASDPHLRSILKELDDLDALQRIAPLFDAIDDSPFKRSSSDETLRTALALDYRPPPPPVVVPLDLEIGHYDRLTGPLWIGSNGISIAPDAPELAKAQVGTIPLALSGTILTADDHGTPITFDMAQARARIARVKCCGQPLLIPAREGSDRATLLVTTGWGQMEAWLLLGRH
jgi:Domain of unknown function (DUF4153)